MAKMCIRDRNNVTRFARYLRGMSDKTQFIVITHRRGTMEEADVLYGVTMTVSYTHLDVYKRTAS